MYDFKDYATKSYPSGHFKDKPFLNPYQQQALGSGVITDSAANCADTNTAASCADCATIVSATTTPTSFSARAMTVGEGLLFTPESFSGFVRTPLDTTNSIADATDAHAPVPSSAAAAEQLDGLTGLFLQDLYFVTAAVENLRLRMQIKSPHRLSTLELIHIYHKYDCLNQIYLIDKI